MVKACLVPMKICHYCGKENQNTSGCCAGCGSALKLLDETQGDLRPSAAAAPKNRPRVLDSRSATSILLATLAVEVFCGVLIGVISVNTENNGIRNNEQLISLPMEMVRGLTVVIPIVVGFVTVWMSRALIADHLKDGSPNGAAWVRGNWSAVAGGFCIGIVLALCLYALNAFIRSHLVLPRVTYNELGPFDQMAYVPGLPQLLWIVTGLLLAPLPEEILFRNGVSPA